MGTTHHLCTAVWAELPLILIVSLPAMEVAVCREFLTWIMLRKPTGNADKTVSCLLSEPWARWVFAQPPFHLCAWHWGWVEVCFCTTPCYPGIACAGSEGHCQSLFSLLYPKTLPLGNRQSEKRTVTVFIKLLQYEAAYPGLALLYTVWARK